MPPASDWRSASTAEKLMSLDRPQFAAEFLRRNHDYSEDYRDTQDQIASGVARARRRNGQARTTLGFEFSRMPRTSLPGTRLPYGDQNDSPSAVIIAPAPETFIAARTIRLEDLSPILASVTTGRRPSSSPR